MPASTTESAVGPFFGGPLPHAAQTVPRPPALRATPGSAVPGAFVPDPLHRKLSPNGPTPSAVVPAAVARQSIPAPPAALAKRPKGRWFIATLAAMFLAALGYAGQRLLFQFPCFGVVAGEVVEVAAPWTGVVRSLEVRDGDRVEAGDLLLTIDNLPDRQQLERWNDELRVAEAELEAKSAELRFHSELRGDRRHKARAEYYENWGLLLQEQARLTEFAAKRKRNDQLRQRDAVSEVELEGVRWAEEGQRAKVDQLKLAVEEMKNRVASSERPDLSADELKPKVARIALIRGEIARLQARLEQGRIRSPVSGRVVQRRRSVGERIQEAALACEILAEDSLHIIAYLPQSRGGQLKPGQHVQAWAPPQSEPVLCVVERAGLRLHVPPSSVAGSFHTDEPLRSWRLRPLTPVESSAAFCMGSAVRISAPIDPPADSAR